MELEAVKRVIYVRGFFSGAFHLGSARKAVNGGLRRHNARTVARARGVDRF